MGRNALSRWFFTVAMLALASLAPAAAYATATARGVVLNAAAGCGDSSLNITLTTSGAARESWRATNLAGTTLAEKEAATTLIDFNGTFNNFQIGLAALQPANTLIGTYAYVGETPPSAATTAEFFIYYNCTTRQVLLTCFGAYGTCPQTARQAELALSPSIPTLSQWGLVLTMLLLAGAGASALRPRRA
jgi:hypothetical protein